MKLKYIASLKMGDVIGGENRSVFVVVGDVKNYVDGTADVPLAHVADAQHAPTCTTPRMREQPSGELRCRCGATVKFFVRRYIHAGEGAQIATTEGTRP